MAEIINFPAKDRAKQYRAHAASARDMAAVTVDEIRKSTLLNLARQWELLAAYIEKPPNSE